MTTPVTIVAHLTLFVVIGLVFVAMNLLLGRFLRPLGTDPERAEVYECGEPTIGSNQVQFDLRFYVVALLFLVFDVEVAFFFPWANVFGTSTQLMDPHLQVSVPVAGQGDQPTAAVEQLYGALGAPVPLGGPNRAAELAHELHFTGSWLAWFALADMLVFFAVLLVGFAYIWRRGDIDWVRAASER